MANSILPLSWDVPQIFRDRLGDAPGRQRLMQADGHLLLVTHRVPTPKNTQRAGRYFWRDAQKNWHSSDLGPGTEALRKHLAEYADAISRLETTEAQAQTSEEYFHVISQLAPLLRATRNLHLLLQQAREVSGNDRTIINYRDQAYELERTTELLYNEAKNELDFLIAQRSEQQAASSHKMATSAHRLNVLAAFFFPMVTLATIFSTQLRHGLEELYVPIPFVVMLGVGLCLGIGLNWFVNLPIAPKPRKRHGADEPIPRET